MNRHQSRTLQTLLIKPTGPNCNIECRYCFYRHKPGVFTGDISHRMSEETLESVIRQAMDTPTDSLAFVWQGGEPTLMGLDFFEKVIALQKRFGSGQSIGNALQTNGLNIDANWIRFLKRYNFLVGLSIDGPADIHDQYRVGKAGSHTGQMAAQKARLLLGSGITANSLTVINRVTADHPDEIYSYLKRLGFSHMQFVPCVPSGVPDANCLPDPEALGRFLCRLFDLWNIDFDHGRPTTSIRLFESLFYRYVSRQPPDCTLLNVCGTYLLIEHNGDVYPCDFFVRPEWKLGNVAMDNLAEIFTSEKHRKFGRLKADRPDNCRNCQWLSLCYGGCTAERAGNSFPDSSLYCEGYRMFFEHADGTFKQMARQWVAQQKKQNPPGKTGRNQSCPCGSGKKYKHCCG